MTGSILTSCEAEVNIKLPELNFTAHIFAPFHPTSQKSNYDVIFGQDLLLELEINLDFPKQLRWLERNQDTQKIH